MLLSYCFWYLLWQCKRMFSRANKAHLNWIELIIECSSYVCHYYSQRPCVATSQPPSLELPLDEVERQLQRRGLKYRLSPSEALGAPESSSQPITGLDSGKGRGCSLFFCWGTPILTPTVVCLFFCWGTPILTPTVVCPSVTQHATVLPQRHFVSIYPLEQCVFHV